MEEKRRALGSFEGGGAESPTNLFESHVLVGMTQKWDNLLAQVTLGCGLSSEREKFVLVIENLWQRKLKVCCTEKVGEEWAADAGVDLKSSWF